MINEATQVCRRVIYRTRNKVLDRVRLSRLGDILFSFHGHSFANAQKYSNPHTNVLNVFYKIEMRIKQSNTLVPVQNYAKQNTTYTYSWPEFVSMGRTYGLNRVNLVTCHICHTNFSWPIVAKLTQCIACVCATWTRIFNKLIGN